MTARATVVALVALTLFAHLAAQLALGLYTAPEAFEYDAIARSIVGGDGYVYPHLGTSNRAFASPLYPFILAGAYAVFGQSPLGPGLVQLGFAVGLTLATYALARRWLDPDAAALAGAAAATHPGLLVLGGKIHALPLDAFLMALSLLALVALRERPSASRAVLLGLVVGAVALERATFLVFIALAFAWMAGSATLPRRLVGPLAGLSVVVAVTVVSPWLVRNATLLGAPIITATANEVLWYGNNPNAAGGALTADVRPMLEADPELRSRVWGRPEVEQDRIFRDEALAFIASDPMGTVRRDLVRLFEFWWFSPRTGTLYPSGWVAIYGAYYVALLALAAAGAVILARSGEHEPLVLLAIALVSVSVVHAVYYVEGRHRWQIEWSLFVLAAVPASSLLRLVVRRRRRAPRLLGGTRWG